MPSVSNGLTVDAQDGEFQVADITLDAFEGGEFARLTIAGLAGRGKDSGVEFALAGLTVADTNLLKVSKDFTPREAKPGAAEVAALARQIRLGELTLDGLQGRGPTGRGQLARLQIVGVHDLQFDKLEIADGEMSAADRFDFTLASLTYNIAGRMNGLATHGDYAIKGLVFRPLDPQTKPMLESIGWREVELGLAGSVDWVPEARTASLSHQLSVRNGAQAGVALALSQFPTVAQVRELQQLFLSSEAQEIDPQKFIGYLEEVVVDSLTLKTRDLGLLEIALRQAADRQGQPVAAMKDALAVQAEIALVGLLGEARGIEQAKAARAFLAQGGELGTASGDARRKTGGRSAAAHARSAGPTPPFRRRTATPPLTDTKMGSDPKVYHFY